MARRTARAARIVRKTRETQIDMTLGLDGPGGAAIRSPVPFLNHMLELFAAHGGFALRVVARGDTPVDDHHLVEDLGICLGQALVKALGDKKGIRRYGHAVVPMDDAQALCAIDISGRPFLRWAYASLGRIKTFDTGLVEEFLLGFTREAKATLHVAPLNMGKNAHHNVEAVFKSLGQALGMAVERKGAFRGVPSTKGLL